jgi:hypothetical protein
VESLIKGSTKELIDREELTAVDCRSALPDELIGSPSESKFQADTSEGHL